MQRRTVPKYGRGMGSLRSALDELRAEDIRSLSDEELADHVVELERAVRALEAARARAVAEVEARRTYAADGFRSATSWLAHRTGVPRWLAAQQVRLARALPHMPRTRAALGGGEISFAAATLLATAQESDADAFARCESALVEAARTLGLRELRLALERWRQLVDAEHAERADQRRFERRAVYVSSTLDGMVRFDGDLDPETGQVVLAAIRDHRRPARLHAAGRNDPGGPSSAVGEEPNVGRRGTPTAGSTGDGRQRR
jgi:hypothetical protein